MFVNGSKIMASKHVLIIETNVVKTASFILTNNVFKNNCSNKNIWTCQHKAATAFISYMVLQTARLTSLHLKTGVTWLPLCHSVWEYSCTTQSTISFHITITNALVYWHISNQNQVHTCKFSRIKARKTNLFNHRLKITNLALFVYVLLQSIPFSLYRMKGHRSNGAKPFIWNQQWPGKCNSTLQTYACCLF
jgi:hypothetical protein